MKFPLILFDADDTLFDFSQCEKHSFTQILSKNAITVSESVYQSYQEINRDLWQKFERGKISKTELRVDRFKLLFQSYGFEGDPVLLSQAYLDVLKEQVFLIEGAQELCKKLAMTCEIGVVTNGIEEVQKHRFKCSPLAPYINFIVVSEECGSAKPDRRIFDFALAKASHKNLSNTLMVGDRLDTDILGAKAIGMKTCWFNPTKKRNEHAIIPDFEVDELTKILEIATAIGN